MSRGWADGRNVKIIRWDTHRGLQTVVTVVRGRHYCGYVERPTGLTDDGIGSQVTVHGGVTCLSGDWVGFDCAHAFDLCVTDDGRALSRVQGRVSEALRGEVQRWTPADVEAETERLAEQLAVMSRE